LTGFGKRKAGKGYYAKGTTKKKWYGEMDGLTCVRKKITSAQSSGGKIETH